MDGIFIVLPDNPRIRDGPGGSFSVSGGSWQQLQSGELIRVPHEPTPFEVHMYGDDYAY